MFYCYVGLTLLYMNHKLQNVTECGAKFVTFLWGICCPY
jgi:hypothetical protein